MIIGRHQAMEKMCGERKKEARAEQRLGNGTLGCWAVWLEAGLQKLVLKMGNIMGEGVVACSPPSTTILWIRKARRHRLIQVRESFL